jgi:hypothetical protein
MIVSDETAREFQKLYRDEYGEDISLDEAREEASHLLGLYRLLIKRLPSERNDPTQKLRDR